MVGDKDPDRPVLSWDAPGIDDLLQQLRCRVLGPRATLQCLVRVLRRGVRFLLSRGAHLIDANPGSTTPSTVYIVSLLWRYVDLTTTMDAARSA